MKNLKRSFLLLALLAGLIYSCEKDSFEEAETIIPKITTAKVLDNIESVYNPVNIKEYTHNALDADDENINAQLLDIAIAAREYFKKYSQNEIIMKQANLSSNKCFNLNELASINSLKSANEKYLNLISAIKNADLKHTSTNPLKSGVIEEYVPAIHIVNLETADMNKQPLICPGFEVNSEIAGLENYEDYIVAWFYDENDSLNEILINEEIAMATSHPVFVIDNADQETMAIEKSALQANSTISLKSLALNYDIRSFEYQINHRYEGSGKSEFCITAGLINESGSTFYCLNNGADLWTEIAEVHKDYIGDPLYKWQAICNQDIEPYASNYLYWNTYERDWFNSSKLLGHASKNGGDIYLYGNRKYFNEWYAWDPYYLENYPLDLTSIVYNYQKTYSNSKGSLEFKVYNTY